MNNTNESKLNVRQIVSGMVCICCAVTIICFLRTTAGEAVTHLIGKGAWYLPYVTLVFAVRSLLSA